MNLLPGFVDRRFVRGRTHVRGLRREQQVSACQLVERPVEVRIQPHFAIGRRGRPRRRHQSPDPLLRGRKHPTRLQKEHQDPVHRPWAQGNTIPQLLYFLQSLFSRDF